MRSANDSGRARLGEATPGPERLALRHRRAARWPALPVPHASHATGTGSTRTIPPHRCRQRGEVNGRPERPARYFSCT
jgi:hypothetical protein